MKRPIKRRIFQRFERIRYITSLSSFENPNAFSVDIKKRNQERLSTGDTKKLVEMSPKGFET